LSVTLIFLIKIIIELITKGFIEYIITRIHIALF
jgi:hypothetical protein